MDFERKKQMSWGVILSYTSIFIKLISGILYTPIVLHSLGQIQYGIYALCTSFISYLTILNAGTNAAYIRFFVQKKATVDGDTERLNGLFCEIFFILALTGLLGGLLIAHFAPIIFGTKISIDEYVLAKKCFVLLAINTAVEIFTCLFRSFIIANEKFFFSHLIDAIVSLFCPILTLPFLFWGYSCVVIIQVRLIVSIIVIVIDIIFCHKKLIMKFVFKKSDKAEIINISQFIVFITFQSIVDQLNWQIDKFILARTHGTREISVYSVGALFNSYFIMICVAISSVFIAEINRLIAKDDKNRLNNIFRRTCKLFTYLVGFIITAFMIFGKSFILRWVGIDYIKAFTVAWMLMLPVSFALIMGLGQDIARAKNKHQIQIVINICICIVNMIISIPLAIHFGAVGSAFGTFIAEIIICIIVQPIYYKRVLGIDVENVFLDLMRYLPGLILPVIFGVAITHSNLLKTSYKSLILYGTIFTIIYVISVILFSMNKEDRKHILVFLKGRKN